MNFLTGAWLGFLLAVAIDTAVKALLAPKGLDTGLEVLIMYPFGLITFYVTLRNFWNP